MPNDLIISDIQSNYKLAYENNKFSPSTTPYIKDLISVIVPVYNVEKYVAKCIDSILNQTYTNFELILVNDCSKDNSLKILQEYKNKDKRITIIDLTENVGGAEAKNVGYRQAKGEYIHFLDSDDYFSPDILQKAIDKIKEVNTDLVLNFNIVCCYEEGISDDVKNKHGTDKNWVTDSYKGEGFYSVNEVAVVPQWRYLIKHSYLDSCIPFFIKGMTPNYDQYFANVVAKPLKQVYCYMGGEYNYLIKGGVLSSNRVIYDFIDDFCYIDVFRHTYEYYKEHVLLDVAKFNLSSLQYLLSLHINKSYCYTKIKELFVEFYKIILTRKHLYLENEIEFFRNVLEFENYGDFALRNKMNSEFYNNWKQNNEIKEQINNNWKLKKIKLFGFIPLLKIKNKENKVKIYLFGFIPFLKIKRK
ncbi:MAG: hypothetical protein Ta2D_09390 [Rickettsiales bacterium]|nr:MAG: hypothetical protein Ta2D_09390 [Rickettsiales bacterium]